MHFPQSGLTRLIALSTCASLASFVTLAPGCDNDVNTSETEVDCSVGEACEDSFRLAVIPGGAGFEIGSYHLDIIAYGETFVTDCVITGSPDATQCEPLMPLQTETERPTFEMVKDANGVVEHFEIKFASAPESVQVRVLFSNESLADETFVDYEEVRIDESCPVLCKEFDQELTVLP